MRPVIIISTILFFLAFEGIAQISPGPLSNAHKQLEGLKNCTQCHTIGDKITDQKCLDCHKEIQSLIREDKGFHASPEVGQKTCVDCHSEHHGLKFDLDRFDQKTFDHKKAGYELEGAHKIVDCKDCHKPEFIPDPAIKKLEGTFLGMETSCLECHDDYHQGTLENDCVQCHGMNEWAPADLFDHNDADYKLLGAHKKVDCLECHKETIKAGKEFQVFTDIPFNKCTDCHDDTHDGAFGTNCTSCHNESSWSSLNKGNNFNHGMTDYPLEGLHAQVDCKECHTKGSFTTPIDFTNCINCHEDYHLGEFVSENPASDCKECHEVSSPFTTTLFGIERHQATDFKLDGAHLATACFTCHVSEERWDFRDLGENCVDCHENIHKDKISEKYFPEENCTTCHTTSDWVAVTFDHQLTGWDLEGKHQSVSCRECHFTEDNGLTVAEQRFQLEDNTCVACHENVHGDQFSVQGKTDCVSCHTVAEKWNVENFKHNETLFPLEGKHAVVDCKECHKPKVYQDQVERIEYKIQKFECRDCHSS